MANYLTGDLTSHHCLGTKELRFACNPTTKTDDSIVSIGNSIYRVNNIDRLGKVLSARRLRLTELDTSDVGLDLPWHRVGIYGQETSEMNCDDEEFFSFSQITGKAVAIGDNYYGTFPQKWFLR